MVFTVLIFGYHPYKNRIQSFSVKEQLITIVYFLAWNAFKDYRLIAQDEVTEVPLFMALIIRMLTSMILAILRIIF